MTLIGVLLAVAIPFLRGATDQGSVRGAGDAVATMHAVAKQSAIQRSRTTMLVMDGAANTMVVVARNAAGAAWDTLGRVENLDERFGVRFAASRDTLVFTPRGIGIELSGTAIVVSKGSYVDTITVSAAGRLIR